MNNAAPYPPVKRGALWFGLLGGLAAWALHLTAGYLLVYNGCVLGLDMLRLWLILITAIFALVTLAAIGSSYFTWRRTSRMGERELGVDVSRIRFMSMLGMWLSGVSLLALVLVAIPIFFLQICG